MKELTDKQIDRQDFVDNAIFSLIRSVNPSNKEIEWDIEIIGEIRDVVKEWLIIKLRITEEQEIYPSLGQEITD